MGNKVIMLPRTQEAFDSGQDCMIVVAIDKRKGSRCVVPCIEWKDDISTQVDGIHTIGYFVPYRIRVRRKP